MSKSHVFMRTSVTVRGDDVSPHGFQKSLNDGFRCHLILTIYNFHKKGHQEPFRGAWWESALG